MPQLSSSRLTRFSRPPLQKCAEVIACIQIQNKTFEPQNVTKYIFLRRLLFELIERFRTIAMPHHIGGSGKNGVSPVVSRGRAQYQGRVWVWVPSATIPALSSLIRPNLPV